MAKLRSPNYPNFDLQGALALVDKIYAKDGRNKVSRATLATHLGHESLSGPALGKIGALRAYELLDGSGDELRVSDDAISALKAPRESPERKAALARLAMKPALFREIQNEFPTPPSRENLQYWLIKKGFSDAAAAIAAKSYLNTMALVTELNGDYNLAESEVDNPMGEVLEQSPDSARFLNKPIDSIQKPIQEVFHLPEGTVTITFPKRLSMESYQDLEDQLSLILRRVKRQSGKDEEAAN